MRKRTIRDLGTVAGVLAIIAGIVLFQAISKRGDLRVRMNAWRQETEDSRRNAGFQLLSWDLLGKTKGKYTPTFDEELVPYDQALVNIVGFMVPLYEFRDAAEFLLLPLPIECYFCAIPPMRDVIFVQMSPGETARIVNEPILINGTLNLNPKGLEQEGEAESKFFYTITNAKWGPAEEGGELTTKRTGAEHQAPAHLREVDMNLYEGVESNEAEGSSEKKAP